MRNVSVILVTFAALLVAALPLAAQEVGPPIGGGNKDRNPGAKPSIEILTNDCEVVGSNLVVYTDWEDTNVDPDDDELAMVTNKEAKLLIKTGNGKNRWMDTGTMVMGQAFGGLETSLTSSLTLCAYGAGVADPGTAITALVNLTTQDGIVFSATCEDDESTDYVDESDNEIPADIDGLCD
jgi:hypothetical protein